MTSTLANITSLAYLISAVLFILALKGLSSPLTSRRGNVFGMIGMAIAVMTTFLVADRPVLWLIGGAVVIGAAIGATAARRVQMTKMPELVAAFHSLVGITAVLIAVAAIFQAGEEHTG
ncbi:MAG: NAD(P)(+) transhydrogenase (Re/Si-specific) subunit beta, partial [Burkholderiaceae bacterium]